MELDLLKKDESQRHILTIFSRSQDNYCFWWYSWNFNQLVFKLCIQYQLTDTLLIVAGDCGFGFEKKEYYEQIVRRNAKRMNQANNWIVFVRGNHDNPAYFDGAMLNFKRFVAVPDYSILQVCNHTILCVGGSYLYWPYLSHKWME